MTILLDIAVIMIACFSAYLAYVVAEQALAQLNLGPPRIVAMAVAMITLVSVLHVGSIIVLLVLIPYAALGITLLTLSLLRFIPITSHQSWKSMGWKVQQAHRWIRGTVANQARRFRQKHR